jgi:hypothetical protein
MGLPEWDLDVDGACEWLGVGSSLASWADLDVVGFCSLFGVGSVVLDFC